MNARLEGKPSSDDHCDSPSQHARRYVSPWHQQGSQTRQKRLWWMYPHGQRVYSIFEHTSRGLLNQKSTRPRYRHIKERKILQSRATICYNGLYTYLWLKTLDLTRKNKPEKLQRSSPKKLIRKSSNYTMNSCVRLLDEIRQI